MILCNLSSNLKVISLIFLILARFEHNVFLSNFSFKNCLSIFSSLIKASLTLKKSIQPPNLTSVNLPTWLAIDFSSANAIEKLLPSFLVAVSLKKKINLKKIVIFLPKKALPNRVHMHYFYE